MQTVRRRIRNERKNTEGKTFLENNFCILYKVLKVFMHLYN